MLPGCRVVVIGAQQHRHDARRGLGQCKRMLDELAGECIGQVGDDRICVELMPVAMSLP
jgi:hypothetical protein